MFNLDMAALQHHTLSSWAPWSSWRPCDSTCPGNVTHVRTRDCEEAGMCRGVSRATASATWSAWSPWSPCSVTCREGIQVSITRPRVTITCLVLQTRTRECAVPQMCQGDASEEQYCIRPCREFRIRIKMIFVYLSYSFQHVMKVMAGSW